MLINKLTSLYNDFGFDSNCDDINYILNLPHGFVVKVTHDIHADNPFEAWDCMTPMCWTGLTNRKVQGETDLLNPLKWFTVDQVSRHHKAICDIIEYDLREHNKEAFAYKAGGHTSLSDARYEVFCEFIDNEVIDMSFCDWQYRQDWFVKCVKLFKLIRIHATMIQRHGYSQGDTILTLFVDTPDYLEQTGMKPSKSNHDYNADLFAQWAWGDTYMYDIKNEEGVIVDSCSGYYGEDVLLEDIHRGACVVLDKYLNDEAERIALSRPDMVLHGS